MFRVVRLAALAAAVLVSVFVPSAPQAEAATFDPNSMVFPIDGEYRLSKNFGACRDGCSRRHEGVDIMAPKMEPVVAVADGTLHWVSKSQSDCCHLAINHGGGWVTRYIHLNNDTPGTDDGKGWGIAPGLTDGTFVTRGQLIGWVGDSGNAENTAPHLHFELRKDGKAIDPYGYLLKATEVWNGTFRDDDRSIHEADIEWIAERGITRGCNPPTNDRFCPNDSVTRGEMAAFLVRALGLTTGSKVFDDTAGHRFQSEIARLEEAGITKGCNPPDNTLFCPDQPVTRAEMAAFMTRALELEERLEDPFVDDDGHLFEAEIERLATAGITKGCNPPVNDRYCPDVPVTRAEMAAFLARALKPLES